MSGVSQDTGVFSVPLRGEYKGGPRILTPRVGGTGVEVGGGHSPDTSPHFHDVEARLAYAAAMTPTTV